MQLTPFNSAFSSIPVTERAIMGFTPHPFEEDHDATCTFASLQPITVGKVILFTSGMGALNYTAIRSESFSTPAKIEYLVCVDRSHSSKAFWEFLSNLIPHASRRQCTHMIKRFIARNSQSLFEKPCEARKWIKNLNEELRLKISWLSRDIRYQKIQQIFVNHCFVFVQGDLCSTHCLRGIVTVLRERNLFLDSVYLSNTREYAETDCLLEYLQHSLNELRHVSTHQTYVIDTKPRMGGLHQHKPLFQRIRTIAAHVLEPSPSCQSLHFEE